MSTGSLPGGSSRRLAALFLAVVAPPTAALVWLGWQLLDNDRTLWAQRDVEVRHAAASAIARSLEQSLAEAEHLSAAAMPEGIVQFTISREGVHAEPANRLLWYPTPAPLPAAGDTVFAAAEKLEFRGPGDEAERIYRELARSPKPAVRAGAFLRLARMQRRASKWDEALAAYRSLANIQDVSIEGVPADLLARRAACSVLEESGRASDLRQEATALESDLLAGRWVLDRSAWDLAVEQIEQWTRHPIAASAERKAFSDVADYLWNEWSRNAEARAAGTTRRLVVTGHTLLWRAGPSAVVVVAVSPKWLEAAIRKARQAAGTTDSLALLNTSGNLLAGEKPSSSPALVTSRASDTGLPWNLVLSPGDTSLVSQQIAVRRRLLSFGLVAIVSLLAGGSYVLWRVIHRELAVARLQTEFVSTVSHEFRTPLTSLQHVTELLEEDDEMPRDRRRAFYEALGRNTERLHRLVESLLDFSRMESGRKPYDLQPVDAASLTAQVVGEFRKEVEPRGFTVELDLENAALFPLRADASSLTNALWNLLDNAVKYSPERQTVRVSVRRHPSGVAIAVQDHGIGIPRHEQGEIFRRFVRGEKASRLGIKGTGLGLAMVSHIVQAHGGAIELESEEGAGSIFRMVLPARA